MPFTYLIGWSIADKWYIGSRWADGCAPSDLWVTYFTSYKYVEAFRKQYGEPDVIEIDRVFNDKKSALEREIFLLKTNRVKERECFLNKAVGGVYDPNDPAIRAKNAAARTGVPQSKQWIENRTAWKRGVPHTQEHREAISKSHLGVKLSEQHCAAISKVKKGNTNRRGTSTTEEGKRNIALSKLGTRHPETTKQKMSASHLGTKYKIVTCPVCNATGGESAMKRWHFDNCKFKE